MSLTDAAACFADRAITLQQLRAIAPHAPGSHLDFINAAMAAHEVNTPRRQAAFLAQVMFECNQGREFVEEASGAAYEGRRDLGNTQPGDGPRFKGRGAIQLTGRTNYTRASGALGVDFVAHPDWAAEPRWAYEVAGWYWHSRGLNDLADAGDFESITKRINGGLGGYSVRLEFYARAARALGCVPESGGQSGEGA